MNSLFARASFYLVLVGFLVCALAPTAAFAGVKFTAEVVDPNGKIPLTIYLDKAKVRLDGPSPTDKTQEYRILYDSTADTLAYLDVKRKTVLQLPVAQLEMLATLAAKLSKTKIPPSAAGPYQFKDLKKTKLVGSWTCKRYELKRGNEKPGEICSASLPDLGLTRGDLAPLEKLSKALLPLTKTVGGGAAYPDFLWEKIDERGLALEATASHSGRIHTFVMRAIDKKALPADTFEVPTGYQPQLLMK